MQAMEEYAKGEPSFTGESSYKKLAGKIRQLKREAGVMKAAGPPYLHQGASSKLTAARVSRCVHAQAAMGCLGA